MIKQVCNDWCWNFGLLTSLITTLKLYPDARADVPKRDRSKFLTSGCLAFFKKQERLLEDYALHRRVEAIEKDLYDDNSLCIETFIRELEGIRDQLVIALSRQQFCYIDRVRATFLDRKQAFGELVDAKIPKARADIADACKAIAANLDTAAVYHLMRAAELGLRAIANSLGVTVSDKKQQIPIEYATWEQLTANSRNKITAIRQDPKGPQKNEALQAYSDIADRSEYIRDLWRNDLSHTRRRYSGEETIGIFDRINGFMQAAAKIL
jgi:hypothetical protein